MLFSIGNEFFKLYVEDEYDDFKIQHPALNLCLVLRELENYQFEQDFLTWCSVSFLDSANSQVLNYYRNLDEFYKNIERNLGKIDSQIHSLDFELNAGAAQALRNFSK